MSESDEHDATEEFPEITALLRDEPVDIDPARRDSAISAALALGVELYSVPDGSTSDTTDDTTGDTTDELARRRAASPTPAPVPTPTRRSLGGRRGVLVAAAIVLVAGIGITGIAFNLFSGNDLVEVADLGGASSSADGAGGASAEVPASASSEIDQELADQDGSAADRAPAAGSAESAPTTTIAAFSSSAELGEFDTVERLVAAARSTARSSSGDTAVADATPPADGSSCPQRQALDGLVEVARATVRAVPVLVATDAAGGGTVVVLDLATCTVLAQG